MSDDFLDDQIATAEYVGSFTDEDEPDTAVCCACWRLAPNGLLCDDCEGAVNRLGAVA